MNGDPIKTFNHHTNSVFCCCFSPNEQFILSGSRDDKALILWSIESGNPIKIFKGHEYGVLTI